MSEPAAYGRGEPMYRVIADDLRRKIESGELAPGAQLQTEVELREAYGQNGMVSRNTVRDAIKLLIARGLVVTRPGQGTFIVPRMRPFISKLTADPEAGGVEDEVYQSEVKRQGRTPEETIPRVEVQPASKLVAASLELGPGASVISRHQQRRIDGLAWSMQTTFYSMDLLQRGVAATRLLEAASVKGGMVAYLKEHLGIVQVGWRDTIIARPATNDERDFFGLPDKVQTAMLEVRRTSWDDDGEPIRFTVTVYPADRNQFEMEAGRVPPFSARGNTAAAKKPDAGAEDSTRNTPPGGPHDSGP